MKFIIGLMCLVLMLVSCGENEATSSRTESEIKKIQEIENAENIYNMTIETGNIENEISEVENINENESINEENTEKENIIVDTNSNIKAYVEDGINGKQFILDENGTKSVVMDLFDEGLTDVMNIQITDDSKLLLYYPSGLAYAATIYDIEKKEMIMSSPFANHGITSDNKFYYVDSQNEMTGDYFIKIYSTDSFDLVADIFQDFLRYYNMESNYDSNGNVIEVKFLYDEDENGFKLKVSHFTEGYELKNVKNFSFDLETLMLINEDENIEI